MTSILSCVVATIALAADPTPQGLPFGLPPGPDDAVISHVAPPQCLFYLNWAGTASPHASSGSETEKMLAEPEVQDLLNGISKVIVAALRQADTAAAIAASQPLAKSISSPAPMVPGTTGNPSHPPAPAQAATPMSVPPPAANPYAAPASTAGPPAPGLMAATSEKPAFKPSAEDVGDWVNVLLTHPTAIFVTDLKVTPAKITNSVSPHSVATEKDLGTRNAPYASQPAGQQPAANPPAEIQPQASARPDVEIQGGMVVSLGPDSARLHARFNKYLNDARKSGAERNFKPIKIAGQTWYRSKPTKPGDKNIVTLGFHEKYFVVGVGANAVQGILARWNSTQPTWLTTALAETSVPRRTGIIYLNLKSLRDKLLPLAPSRKDALAALELLGLANLDSLVSTTGLDDYGMINRTLLALDGKPRGLLDMVSDRPLSVKDLEPIPSDALMAVAARVDLSRTLKVVTSAYENLGAAGNADAAKTVEELKKGCGPDVQRFLAALGSTWCVYNSPTEGEVPFLGWTAVVPIRDRTALLDSWQKIRAAEDAKKKKEGDGQGSSSKGDLDTCVSEKDSSETPAEFRTCRFAGHEIHYLAGQGFVTAPALCILDHEAVMTLNMPAMKAYLTRKNHRSLAALPGVKLALNDGSGPAAVSYCDTPKLFDSVYPLLSLLATAVAGVTHEAPQIDLEPTYWPSAPAIRSHLRPDVTTLQRTPHGLQFTYRYCLPTGGAGEMFLLTEIGATGMANFGLPPFPMISPANSCELVEPQAAAATAPATAQNSPPLPWQLPPGAASYPAAAAAPALPIGIPALDLPRDLPRGLPMAPSCPAAAVGVPAAAPCWQAVGVPAVQYSCPCQPSVPAGGSCATSASPYAAAACAPCPVATGGYATPAPSSYGAAAACAPCPVTTGGYATPPSPSCGVAAACPYGTAPTPGYGTSSPAYCPAPATASANPYLGNNNHYGSPYGNSNYSNPYGTAPAPPCLTSCAPGGPARLDDGGLRRRKTVVIRLKNAPAADVAAAITNLLTAERQSLPFAAAGATTPFEQMEREVVVVGEPCSNSLILSAAPKCFEEMRGIIEQLDSRPPGHATADSAPPPVATPGYCISPALPPVATPGNWIPAALGSNNDPALFNSTPAPVAGGLAANPALGAAVTVDDVIAMTGAMVGDELILNHIKYHGLAAPLRPADVIALHKHGVSPTLIAVMQTVVSAAEREERTGPGLASTPSKQSDIAPGSSVPRPATVRRSYSWTPGPPQPAITSRPVAPK